MKKKPLHKHIGHHAKRFHGHFTKYLYERDTIFATLWVFIFIVGLGLIPLNLYVLNPIKMGLKDFDYTDLSYAELGKGNSSKLDSNIVIINIGMADRQELSYLIEKAASYEPKVIGLDVWMAEEREPEKDSLLQDVIRKTPSLVLASRYLPGKDHVESEFRSNYFTDKTGASQGFVNFFNEELATVRVWNPFFKSDKHEKGQGQKSFVTSIVEKYSPPDYNYLVKRGKPKELINYSRRLEDAKYRLVEPDALMSGIDTSYIKGKIVLMGYISPNPYDVEDKKFTPMNHKFAGKTIPDMDGLVVHANIISMVLEHKYIKKVPSWVNLLIAVVVCWLFMSFFIRYYLENHIWFHLVAKIIQVATAVLFAYLGIFFYDRYNIKLDMKLSLIVIIMAVDVIYFYEAWAVWMHKKFHYHTVFKPHHHG